MSAVSYFLLLAVLSCNVFAVKEYLFKNCNQAGFCHRNRHYAQSIAQNPGKSPYRVDSQSIEILDDHIGGFIVKHLPTGDDVYLPLEIAVLPEGSFRLKINEDRLNATVLGKARKERYEGAANAVFVADQKKLHEKLSPDQVNLTNSTLTIVSGEATLELDFASMALRVLRAGEPQISFNEQHFFNLEHWRSKSENHLHVLELETDFDMFSDSFEDCKSDSKPLGPEAIGFDASFLNYQHVYGIPEHADSLSLKDTSSEAHPYRLFNVDIFEYETNSRMPMYGSVPFMLAARPGNAAGLLWVNSADMFVDIKKSESVLLHWVSESGVLDLVFFTGSSPLEINRKLGSLTGNVALPQEFALGYHQCRWNYNSMDDVLDVSSKMDQHKIPYDTIWLDIDYADKIKYFTWNKKLFPDPLYMTTVLDHTGRNLVVIIDPHLKVGYDVSDKVLEDQTEIKNSNNDTYLGHCWPGESVWIDLLNPGAQPYWDHLHRRDTANGMFGSGDNIHLWNDMSEPSVFNGPETSAPKDNLHYGEWEHRSVHNLWGKSFHELTYNALEKRLEGSLRQRPFVLTRSYFAGSQRTAAAWTGDNMAKWEYLRILIPMILSANVAGMPFMGADVGGFFGDPTPELLVRWYQAGIWYPFFRAHAHIDSRRREPWVAGDPYTGHMRDAIRLRYALLPTLYSTFEEASRNGAPIVRPMFYVNPENQELYGIDDQFWLGSLGILVKPVTEESALEISILVPSSEIFYDYTNGEFHEPIAKPAAPLTQKVTLGDVPMLLEGGHVHFRKDRYRRLSRLMRQDPYHVVVALARNGLASGVLYIDDGALFRYKDGECMYMSVAAWNNEISATVSGNPLAVAAADVEKISVLGVPETSFSEVRVVQGGVELPSSFRQISGVLTITTPKLRSNEDWTVKILPNSSMRHDEL